MKVKTKISALTLALALCGGALVGCGNNPSPTPSTFHVSCSQDATKYTVVGLESTYEVGKEVSFSVTEVSPEDYKVTGVTSDDVTVTTVSALNYKFIMPEKDVILTVTTRAVDKYTVDLSDKDVAVGDEVEFTLKLGATQRLTEVRLHEGETKDATISDDKVTFKEVGTYHLDIYDLDGNKTAISDYQLVVRDIEHGEKIDDPLTPEEAIAIGHTLDITWNEKDSSGTTVWHYGGVSKIKYYIKGVVTYVKAQSDADLEKYKNVTVNLGDFQVFQVQLETYDLDVLKSITVGSELVVHTKLMNFGGKNTDKSNGTVETYKMASEKEYPSIMSVDNTKLVDIQLSEKSLRMKSGDTVTLTATLLPNTGDTVLWETNNEGVATVENGLVTAVANGEATITASVGTISAECKVIVSDEELVLRELEPSEVDPAKSYVIAAKDGTTLKYAKAEIGTNHYMTAVADEGEAATAKLISKGDGKYVIQLDDKYIGYQYSDGRYHNILVKDTEAEAVELTYDATKRAFTLTGADTSSTQLFLAFYSGSFQFSNYKYVDTNTHGMFWGWAAPIAVEEVNLTDTEAEIYVGGTVTLNYTIGPAGATPTTFEWKSSDESVATVANGVVTGLKEGTTQITLKVDGVTCTTPATITVKAKPEGTVTVKYTIAQWCDAQSPAPTSGTTKITMGSAIAMDSNVSFTLTGTDANTGKLYKGNSTGWAVRLYNSGNATIKINVGEGTTLVSASINVNTNSSSLYDAGTDVDLAVEDNSASYVATVKCAVYSFTVVYSTK